MVCKMKIKTWMSALALSLFVGLPVQTQIASATGMATPELLALAEAGSTMAQRNLGKRYALGSKDVTKDLNQAVLWYTKAADKGDAESQQYLGYAYGRGLGVTQDWVQAHMWFSLVGASSRKIVPQEKEQAEQNRKFVETKMTPAQIEEARVMAREWLEKHKELGPMANLQD